MTRTDETWFRLREWTQGQTPSERLAAQVVHAEGYEGIDPSHPLGGKDGGKDAVATKDGKSWVMGVYFPRGQQSLGTIKKKITDDLVGARKQKPYGFVFVTNQELTLSERADMEALGNGIVVELYHLERTMHVIDRPGMAQIRKQYLDIEADSLPIDVELSIDGPARYFSDSDIAREKFIAVIGDRERSRFDEADAAARKKSPLGVAPIYLPRGFGPLDDSPPPRTRAQLDERLKRWAEEVRRSWTDSEQYLAAIAWPGLRLRLRNVGRVFLNDVQVIITITGAQGLDWEERDAFELGEFVTPFDPPRRSALDSVLMSSAVDYSKGLQLADAPVTWENTDNQSVTITIDLKHLRPTPAWQSEADILMLRAVDDTASSLTAEWTVTAQTYGDSYSGPAIAIPVEAVTIADSYQTALEARPDRR